MTPQEIEALPYRPCVGVMLLNQTGEVFAGQRLDSSQDAWQMPQGGIEKDEDPQVAALRELQEETGIDPSLVTIAARTADWIPYDLPHELVPNLWKGKYRGQMQLWFLMHFVGTDADVNIQTEVPEFSDWRWIAPSDLIASIVPFKRKTYQAVIREFEGKLP